MDICGAIFDMDGTLVDSLSFWKQEWRKVGIRFLSNPHFSVSDELDKRIRTTTLKECAEIAKRELHIQESVETVFRFFNDSLIAFYKNEAKRKEKVEEALKAPKKENVKMCVASATDSRTVETVLEIFKINRYFEGIVSCADRDVSEGKDKPAIYEKALDLLKTPKEKTVVFEDSFVAPETAKQMGCVTVGIFDENNYDQERVKKASKIYIDRNANLLDAIKILCNKNAE